MSPTQPLYTKATSKEGASLTIVAEIILSTWKKPDAE